MHPFNPADLFNAAACHDACGECQCAPGEDTAGEDSGETMDGETVAQMFAINALRIQEVSDELREAAAYRVIKGVALTVLYADGSSDDIETVPGTIDALNVIDSAAQISETLAMSTAAALASVKHG